MSSTAPSPYRDALGLASLDAWEADTGRVVILDAGRATIEPVDEGQAQVVISNATAQATETSQRAQEAAALTLVDHALCGPATRTPRAHQSVLKGQRLAPPDTRFRVNHAPRNATVRQPMTPLLHS